MDDGFRVPIHSISSHQFFSVPSLMFLSANVTGLIVGREMYLRHKSTALSVAKAKLTPSISPNLNNTSSTLENYIDCAIKVRINIFSYHYLIGKAMFPTRETVKSWRKSSTSQGLSLSRHIQILDCPIWSSIQATRRSSAATPNLDSGPPQSLLFED